MCPEPPAEADGRHCWPEGCYLEYDHYIERSGNRSVLTGVKREAYRRWLRNPSAKPVGDTPKEKADDRNTRTQCLKFFELQDDQLYRKAETVKGHLFPARYCVCVWDSWDIICRTHRHLKHFGKFTFTRNNVECYTNRSEGIAKTHERIHEWYYGITQADVTWVVNRCAICNMSAKATAKPALKMIVSKGTGHRIYIDLMDFRSNMDGPYCWIAQVSTLHF